MIASWLIFSISEHISMYICLHTFCLFLYNSTQCIFLCFLVTWKFIPERKRYRRRVRYLCSKRESETVYLLADSGEKVLNWSNIISYVYETCFGTGVLTSWIIVLIFDELLLIGTAQIILLVWQSGVSIISRAENFRIIFPYGEKTEDERRQPKIRDRSLRTLVRLRIT